MLGREESWRQTPRIGRGRARRSSDNYAPSPAPRDRIDQRSDRWGSRGLSLYKEPNSRGRGIRKISESQLNQLKQDNPLKIITLQVIYP